MNKSRRQDYRLVNPTIKGSVEKTAQAKTPGDAAKQLYENISKYFENVLTSFHITIQDVSSKKFYHFMISEKEDNGIVKFIVYDLGNLNSDVEDKLIEFIDGLDDDDDDIDDLDDNFDDFDADFDIKPSNLIDKMHYFSIPHNDIVGLGVRGVTMPIIQLPGLSAPMCYPPVIFHPFSMYIDTVKRY